MRTALALALLVLAGCAEDGSYESGSGGAGTQAICTPNGIKATILLRNANRDDERSVLVGSTLCALSPSDLGPRPLQAPRKGAGPS